MLGTDGAYAKVPVSSTTLRTRSNSRSSLQNGFSGSGDSKGLISELTKWGMVITIDTPPKKNRGESVSKEG